MEEKAKQQKEKIDVYKLAFYVDKLNYIWWFLEGSLLFWLVNLPLLGALLVVPFKLNYIPFFMLVSLPIGIGFVALLKAMDEVAMTGKMARTFFQTIKERGKEVTLIWAFALVVLGLCFSNLVLGSHLSAPLWARLFYALLSVVVMLLMLNYWLLLASLPQLTSRDGWNTAWKLAILKSGRSATNIMIVIGLFVLLSKVSIYLFFFGIGILAWLLLLNFRPVIDYALTNNKEV